MTIKRQRVNAGSFVEVEADSTDSVDTNGFSSLITSGAITAQYSDTSTIQAPLGLRVGMTQIKIVAGAEFIPPITLISSDWSGGANIVDGDLNTVSGTLSSVVLPTVMEVIVDFGSIASRELSAKFNIAQLSNLSTSLFTRMVSRFFISDTLVFGAELANQTNNVPGTNTGAQNADFFHNPAGPNSFRYVKFTLEQGATNVPSGQRPGRCSVYSVNLPLNATTDATVDIRASDTINAADGVVLSANIDISPNSTVTLDTELLLLESQKYLTLQYTTPGANVFNLNLSEITSVTETS